MLALYSVGKNVLSNLNKFLCVPVAVGAIAGCSFKNPSSSSWEDYRYTGEEKQLYDDCVTGTGQPDCKQ